jgi:DNA-binding LytR/AlgR family response regulator
VFTTAFHNYAVEGYELNSVDYLLKPITYARFHMAVEKLRERVAFRSAQNEKPPADYVFIKQDNRLVRVNYEQIRYIEAEKDFSRMFLTDRKLLAGMHLKMFESMLPKDQFMRVHRSYIVNLTRINSLNGNTIELDKIEIPIGANYKADLVKKLGIH